MPIVSVDEVLPGMRLLKSVPNERGGVLFEAGRLLTRESIAELLAENVKSVSVVGILDPARVGGMLSDVHKRFENTRHEPYMTMLEELVTEHIEELHAQPKEPSPESGPYAEARHHPSDGEEAPRGL